MARDIDALRDQLLRELGSTGEKIESFDLDWSLELKDFTSLPDSDFQKIALDLAVHFAILSDWTNARDCIRRYRKLDPTRVDALIFEMRCLYELESFTEVLALGQTPLSEKRHLLSVNYLMAICFEALEMFPQARNRYESVIRQDVNFLDASLRLSKLQGFGGR
jgi:hypothetical protein